jgi:hypothetical protein
MGPMSKGLMFQPSKQKARLTSDSYWQGPTLGRKFLAKGSWTYAAVQRLHNQGLSLSEI